MEPDRSSDVLVSPAVAPCLQAPLNVLSKPHLESHLPEWRDELLSLEVLFREPSAGVFTFDSSFPGP